MKQLDTLTSLRLTPQLMRQDANSFVVKIEQLLQQLNLDMSAFAADHIALRINEQSIAEECHQAWLAEGKEISSAMINGRPIIVLLLEKPIAVGAWSIDCVELPYPAPGKVYPQQGWEHVEFVIPSSLQTADGYFDELKQRFPDFAKQCDQLDELGIGIKLSSPKGEGERLANPTVAFKAGGVCVKLHPHTLQKVVESEQSD